MSLSEHEIAVQLAVQLGQDSDRRLPWGDIKPSLASAAGVDHNEVRCIGMQDDSVITRAINSPGMTLAGLLVHGFVVLEKTTLDSALDGLRRAIETQPHISTAVVMPAIEQYRPSHVLSRDPDMAGRLALAFPNAAIESDLKAPLNAHEGSVLSSHPGPWILRPKLSEIERRSSAITLNADDPALREVCCGDHVLLAADDGSGGTVFYAAGEVAGLTSSEEGIVVTIKPLLHFPNGPVVGNSPAASADVALSETHEP